MLKWRRRPAWCRLGAAREGGPESLLDAMVFYCNQWRSWGVNFWRFKERISWSFQVPSCRFSTTKEVQLPCTKPHWVIVNMGIFTFTSWKWDIDSVRTPPISDVKSSPRSIPRSDKLSCNINIFLVVSETATPWHGVSTSNCTQQETPGVLSRNWVAIRLVSKTHSNAAVQIQIISEFPDKLYWTYGISWASRRCV